MTKRGRQKHRLTGRGDPGRELDEELSFHLRRRAEELQREGLSADEAARRARAEFGDVEGTRAYCAREDRRRERRARPARLARGLVDDLGMAVRSLVRRPRAVAGPISILAVAVALNVLVFTVVRGVLLTPLPFAHPDRVVVVKEAAAGAAEAVRVAYPIVHAWHRQAAGDATVAAYIGGSLTISTGDRPRATTATQVTAGFFDMLDRPVLLGRAFTPDEHRRDGPRVALISEGLWRRAFGADPRVLDRTIRAGDQEYSVVGVVRAGAAFPDGTDVWTPVEVTAPQILDVAGAKILIALAEMGPTVNTASLTAELRRISAGVDGAFPEVRATSVQDYLLGDVRLPLILLQGAVLLVLLTACANAGGMLLARGVRRRTEIAVRTSMGAGGGRIATALLLEGLLLGAGAGGLGLAGAAALMRPALALVPPGLPRAATIHLHPDIALLAVALAAVTGVLTALVPALAGARTSPATLLRDASAVGATPWLRRLLEGFVVVQVALAVLLSVGAGLLVHSFIATVREDPGFDPRRVTVLDVQLPPTRYPDPATRIAFVRELLDRAASLPGASAVAVGRNLPISNSNMTSPLMVEGSTKPSSDVQIAQVSGAYFDVLRIPIVHGAGFGDADQEGGAPQIIVDENVRTAEGEPLHVGDRAHSFFGPDMRYRDIVGVVGTVRHDGLRAPPAPTAYEPFFQKGGAAGFALLVRSDAPGATVARAAQDLVRSLDPQLPVDGIATMDGRISQSLAEPRFFTVALSVFGALALLLALAGCQAGLAHRVAARRREIGVRIALGASTGNVRRMIVRRGLGLAALGALIGLVSAVPAARALHSQLYGVGPRDPWTWVGTLALLAAAAAIASDIPARRASSTDPVEVLREG